MKRLVLAATLSVACITAETRAQTAGAPSGSELTVYLMTMGQGDQVWERYGHNAIGIRNRLTNTDIVYQLGHLLIRAARVHRPLPPWRDDVLDGRV